MRRRCFVAVQQDAAGLVVGGAGSAISGMWNGKKGAPIGPIVPGGARGSQAMGFNTRDLDDLIPSGELT